MNNLLIFFISFSLTSIVLLSTFFLIIYSNEGITGFVINNDPDFKKLHINKQFLDDYTYTKAICDETNFCIDHLVECDGDILISINPIEGSGIQFDENWKDIRTKEEIEIHCK